MVSFVGEPFVPLYLLFGCFLLSLGEWMVHDWRFEHLWYFLLLCFPSVGPLLAVDSLMWDASNSIYTWSVCLPCLQFLLLFYKLFHFTGWVAIDIVSLFAAFLSHLLVCLLYRSALSFKPLKSSLSFFCLIVHKSMLLLDSDAFCNPMAIHW